MRDLLAPGERSDRVLARVAAGRRDAPLPTVVDITAASAAGRRRAVAGGLDPRLEQLSRPPAEHPRLGGYGSWIRAQLGDWGGADAADAHAAVDHVVSFGLADPGRLGILGLSYGGFMVNWLAATSDRFRAEVLGVMT
jgi:hypothetical protein